MDFYTAQDQARSRSRKLVALFVFAIAAVVVLLWIFTLFALGGADWYQGAVATTAGKPTARVFQGPMELLSAQPGLNALILVGWTLALVVPVVVRRHALSRSGEVARSLGGVRATRDNADPAVRRLLNVVEEMAIAAGLPVPEVYVLEHEPSINAFAAGLSPSQATIGITRGALQALDRDQLQGVIAHEFSHILNGDMRLNVQLMAWIAGLFGIAHLGRIILESRDGARGSSVGVLGLPVMAIGLLGGFVGRVLQAGISRQREWLADASAVQFTRDTDGLRGALVAIARQSESGRLRAPQADEAAHLFFAQGVRRWMATHPPIWDRIGVLDRSARARQRVSPTPAGVARGGATRDAGSPVRAVGSSEAEAAGVSTLAGEFAQARGVLTPQSVAGRVGTVDTNLSPLANDLLRSVPAVARDAGTPRQAVEVLLALVLSHDPAVRERQQETVSRMIGGERGARVQVVFATVRDLDPRVRLPAVQALFPRLRTLADRERSDLGTLLNRVAMADGRMDMFEFCVARLASLWVRESATRRHPPARRTLADCGESVGRLMGVLAWHGAEGDAHVAGQAAAAGLALLGMRPSMPVEPPADWPPRLWKAFDELDALAPQDKRDLVTAMATVTLHDRVVRPAEADLLRTACALLHCPLPLLEAR